MIRGFRNLFREGMVDPESGPYVDLDTALNEPYSNEA
jgi:hypothetical protein